MGLFSKEQIQQLKKIDVIKHFDTVLDSDYKRGTTSEQNNMVADIYDAATGGKVSRNFGCKSCIYNLYRNAGKLYRQSLDFQKKESMRIAREAKAQKAANKNKEIDNKENGEG